MIIKVVELCWVSYIDDENMDNESDEMITATRIVEYVSTKDTLLEAFQDYCNNYDSDNITKSDDNFDGECFDTIKYLSVEVVEED